MINIDKNELQILWDDGLSIKDIATHFACDTSVVRRVLKSMNIACDRKAIMERKYRIERNRKWDDVKSMLDDGMSINKIVDALDMTYSAIQDLIKEHDYVYNPDKHLISDEYKNQLIVLRKNHSVKEIAKILNKSERTIERHLSNFGLTVATDRQDIKDADVINSWRKPIGLPMG